jgi:hypothetical protein
LGNIAVQNNLPDTADAFYIGYASTASSILTGVGTIEAANSTGIKPISIQYAFSAQTDNQRVIGNGYYTGSSAVTSVSVIGDVNFDAGTVYVYGGV